MNKDKIVLVLAGVLVLIGLLRPDFSNFIPNNKPSVVETDVLQAPTSKKLRAKAEEIIAIFKDSSSPNKKNDAKRYGNLMTDLAKLVSLDGEREVIKNTKELRLANIIAGNMCDLDMKGVYANLGPTCTQVLAIALSNEDDKDSKVTGMEDAVLTPELRKKGVDGLLAIAWATEQSLK